MKLFHVPGFCSLSPHIVAREANLRLELVRVDLARKRSADGRDYLTINPRGYVPALELDDGTVLCEVAALVQYLADLAPEAGLIPAAGTLARVHALSADMWRDKTPSLVRCLKALCPRGVRGLRA